MKHIKHLLILTSILIISSYTYAQDDETLSLNKGTIENQFDYVLKKSGDFRGTNGQMYEAVNLNMFNILKAHTIDSLKTIRKELASSNNKVETQLKEIEGLKSSLENTKSNLDAINAKKDSISFFGAQMSKTAYNFLMWTIITILFGLLLLFVYKFKNNNKITKKAEQNLAEIEEEFEEHRKTALEREQKVRRQLLDEINKQKKGK